MTNNEIIYSEAIAAGIYTQEQADPHYYLAPAYLFTAAQVQPTEDRKHKS